MNCPPKIVTILCFLQTFFIVAGYFIVHSSVIHFQPLVFFMNDNDLDFSMRLTIRLVQSVNSSGLWPLVVPVVWCIVATLISADSEGGWVDISAKQIGWGIVLTILFASIYSIAAFKAIRLDFSPVIRM